MGVLTGLLDPATWVNALLPGRSMASRLSDPSNRSPSSDFWYQSTFGLPNITGLVGGENAWMFVSTSVAAMRLLCGIGADMPLQRKRTVEVNGRAMTNVMERDPVNLLMNFKANTTTLSKSFRSQMIAWQIGWGTAFAEIERTLDGAPLALWPIHPCRVSPVMNDDDGMLWWKIRNQNGMRESFVREADMLRIPYTLMADDGLHGLGVGQLAAQSIGLGQMLEKTEASASSSALPRIVVEHPGRMQKPEQDAFRRQWSEWQAGGDNVPVLLVDGAKATTLNWSATDTDHKARREFNQRDLARWFGVPEDVLNGTEDRTLLFQKTGLHYLEIWEQACDDKLLDDGSRVAGEYWQNDYRSLLKADPVARSTYWTNRFSIGSITPNQIKYEEGENPSATDGSDVEFIQGAMRRLSDPYKTGAENPIGEPKAGKAPPLAPRKPGKAAQALRAARQAVGLMLSESLARAAVREMKRAATDAKNPKTFLPKIEEFYTEHVTHLAEAIEPICKAACAVRWNVSAREIAERWCVASREALLAAAECRAGELADSVGVAVAAWNTSRVDAFVTELKPRKAKLC